MSPLLTFNLKVGFTFSVLSCHRVAARLNAHELQTASDGAHHHHFTSNVVERHTEQSRVATLQAQEVTGDACARFHATLLHHHRFRCACGATGVYQYTCFRVVPLVYERFVIHRQSFLISKGMGMLSVKSIPVPKPCGIVIFGP